MEKLNRFVRTEKGGLAVIFAILLPFIFSCCALVFDGARALSKRARFADALNEAALAIATASTSNPDLAEKAKLKLMLNNYISAYLPNEDITYSDIIVSYVEDVETGTNLPVFDIKAKIDVKTILPMDIVPAFQPTLDMSNNGKVRKGIQDLGRPADYVFVLDFSGSMQSSSAEPGLSRINLLKKVVKDITKKAIESYPETTFAIVPFEMGVPVKMRLVEEDSGLRYPEKNELGGEVPVCSVLMVTNTEEHTKILDPFDSLKGRKLGFDIDYKFWADKSNYLTKLTAPSASATSLPYTLADVNQILDFGRYKYYERYVIPSLNYSFAGMGHSFATLVAPPNQWCTENAGIPLNDASRAAYSCEKPPVDPLLDKDMSIFSSYNQKLIEREMEAARRVFSISGGSGKNLSNIYAMNVLATMEAMFNKTGSHIINFPRYYSIWHDSYRYQGPFTHMCLSSGHDASVFHSGAYNKMAFVKQNTYLIEPTSDLTELNAFQTMHSDGGTDSSTGLLRAVPELMKGPNPRKALIVISDGDDNDYGVRNALHSGRNAGDRVCDRIRDGVKARLPYVEEVDIYFISVVNDSSGQSRTNYWANYCTGPDNAVVATNYDEIMSKLVEIMNKYEETGYFYN
jgi:tight adherence protein G